MRGRSQFSLRQLLFAIFLAGLALTSLRTGGVIASITAFLAVVITTALAILAFVARDALRAFAIGFIVPVLTYTAAVAVLGASELDPYEGKFPTSRLLLPFFKVMSDQTWRDSTGKIIPNYNPASDPNFGTVLAAQVSLAESPDRPTFMVLGHIIIAMAFGYSGAHFAVAVYRKQNDNGAV